MKKDKDVKLPESVKRFMEKFCEKNHEEIIYHSIITLRGNDIIGEKPHDVHYFITAYAAIAFHIVEVNMAIDGETIESVRDSFLVREMVDAITKHVESFRQKVTA